MSTKTKMVVFPVNFSVVNMERFTLFSFKSLCILFIWSEIISIKDVIHAESLASYDKLFNAGVQAYHKERWFECYEHISEALEVYNEATRSYASCRENCQRTFVAVNVEASIELNFLKLALAKSRCLRKCQLEKTGEAQNKVPSSVKADFEMLQPYDYLQICAFKLGKFETAAAAAYTFLMKNPDHEMMKTNVEFYNNMPEIKPEFFVNLEKKPYEVHYGKMKDFYASEDYSKTLVAAEDTIQSYLQELQRCEAMCEGPYDHKDSTDFYIAIADHWASVLKCQSQCTKKLSLVEGESVPDFFPELFNYLQFSHYQLKNYDAAAKATATYLLFKPEDEPMTLNKLYYISDLGVNPGSFVPLESGRQHFISQQMRAEMLQFVTEEYHNSPSPQPASTAQGDMQDTAKPAGKSIKKKKGDLEDYTSLSGSNFRGPQSNNIEVPSNQIGHKDEVYVKSLEDYMLEQKLSLVEEEIQDSNTLVVDGLLTEQQCQELSQLPKLEASGDTNTGDQMSLARAVELTSILKIPSEETRLYLMASKQSRRFLKKYFNLKKPLYNSHTKIVCQSEGDSPLDFVTEECFLQTDGSCVKTEDVESQHAFSGILYLNEAFEDGEFFFAKDDLSPKSLIKGRCGRLVAYDSSLSHGVKAITTGMRCGLVMGFTFQKMERDMAQEEGRMVLQAIHSRERPLKNPILRSLVEERGYDIVMTESELNGPERFTSDRVATEQQCEALINLANDGGIVGDGYKNSQFKKSPHTAHEEFVGLTLTRASEAGGIQGDGYLPKKDALGKVSSPHTDKEVFQGLTVIRAAKLLEEGGVDAESVRLYLELSENSLELVQKYFNLTKPLYFDYTHLVCRTALDESLMERKDLSHPVHSDNCLIQPDGECKRIRPAYIQRDYSAILYLNEDFLGGEFFFTHTNFSVQSTLKPKCGRLVGFNAANYHGVQAVLKGQRCAVAMWYTLDPSYNEKAHAVAWDVLGKLKKAPQALGPPTSNRHDVGEL